MSERKYQARVVRYYKDDNKTTEEDYIVIYIRCWDEDKKKYYWGMNKSWDYKDMLKFSENNPAYEIPERLYLDMWDLQRNGYEIKFVGRKIKEGQGKWDYEE